MSDLEDMSDLEYTDYTSQQFQNKNPTAPLMYLSSPERTENQNPSGPSSRLVLDMTNEEDETDQLDLSTEEDR